MALRSEKHEYQRVNIQRVEGLWLVRVQELLMTSQMFCVEEQSLGDGVGHPWEREGMRDHGTFMVWMYPSVRVTHSNVQ